MKTHHHSTRPDGKRVVYAYGWHPGAPRKGWGVFILSPDGEELSFRYVGQRSDLSEALAEAEARDDVPDEPFEPGFAFALDGVIRSRKGLLLKHPLCRGCGSPFCRFKPLEVAR